MSRLAVVHSSRLRYSHPNLELPPCFHRLHELSSSYTHTSGCPYQPWHCLPHPVEARCGDCPSCLSRSSQTRLAGYRFPSTSPLRHSESLNLRRFHLRMLALLRRYSHSLFPVTNFSLPIPNKQLLICNTLFYS